MNLSTERKIKFWLTSLAKMIFIGFLIFKVYDYTKSRKTSNDAIATEGDLITKTDTIIDKKGEKPPVNVQKSETTEVNRLPNGLPNEPDDSIEKEKPLPGTIGIYIFNENGLDAQVSRHMENTILQNYIAMAIVSNPNKEKLLAGDIPGYFNTETVCIGTTSYKFTESDTKITCQLTLSFDTYMTATRNKIRELSGSKTYYGIGFSQEQAKEVAVKKIH